MKLVSYKNYILAMLLLFGTVAGRAESLEKEVANFTPETLLIIVVSGLMFIVGILIIILANAILQMMKRITREEEEEKAKALGIPIEEEPSTWEKLMTNMTKTVPLEKEGEILLDHDYDGIRELDNHLPPWWKWLFYFTVVFAVVYIFAYHVTDTLPLMKEEYQIEMAEAKKAMEVRMMAAENNIDESNVELVDDQALIADGQQIFDTNCAQCHRKDGGGNIGPNLTDDYWLHGGSVGDIFKTIKYGVPSKGMIAWQTSLTPAQMRNVTSYIVTLKGSNPEGAKGPQGDLYTPSTE